MEQNELHPLWKLAMVSAAIDRYFMNLEYEKSLKEFAESLISIVPEENKKETEKKLMNKNNYQYFKIIDFSS